jgi:hypothetical protein
LGSRQPVVGDELAGDVVILRSSVVVVVTGRSCAIGTLHLPTSLKA